MFGGSEEVIVSELDAIYFMTSTVFGFQTKTIACTFCGHLHLDKDWFSIHPHRRHLCSGCGRNFRDNDISIGNPLTGLLGRSSTGPNRIRVANRTLSIRQEDFPGGLQIWGSNSAILWTSRLPEEEGIHVHVFDKNGKAVHDDTFSSVTIDGTTLDPKMVRTYMAQSALPHLKERVVSTTCPHCNSPHFDTGEHSYTPHEQHECSFCGASFRHRGRLRKCISNPLVGILEELGKYAIRPPRVTDIGLLPETI